jgi:hypothetical protein
MSENKLAFLEPGFEGVEEAMAEAPVETPAAAEGGEAALALGGPDGAEAADEAALKGAAPVAPTVPITAMLDERERRQAAERERDAARRQLEAARAAPAELAPDQAQALAAYQQNMRYSRRFAEREYGKDVIAAVHDWAVARCDADPLFNQQIFASEDPYEAAYQAFQREKILAEVNADDLAAFKAWKAAQTGREPAVSTPTPEPAPPPRSLATVANAGGPGARTDTMVGPGQAHAAFFTR